MKTIMKTITIGREFGSGGREVGLKVATALNIPFYDKELKKEKCRRIFWKNMKKALPMLPSFFHALVCFRRISSP